MYEDKIGYVACDYTQDDTLAGVRHGPIRQTAEEASEDRKAGGYEGVRYAHTDGYLYVDAPVA